MRARTVFTAAAVAAASLCSRFRLLRNDRATPIYRELVEHVRERILRSRKPVFS